MAFVDSPISSNHVVPTMVGLATRLLKPRLHYAIYAASDKRNRRLWRSALLVACVFTLGDVARKWLGVTMRRSVVSGTRPWLLRRNMLGAWMVDANFIFILVSISSYVSFSLACIRLFHPRLCMVFFYFSTYFHHVHPSYRPLIFFSLFLHPEFGLTML